MFLSHYIRYGYRWYKVKEPVLILGVLLRNWSNWQSIMANNQLLNDSMNVEYKMRLSNESLRGGSQLSLACHITSSRWRVIKPKKSVGRKVYGSLSPYPVVSKEVLEVKEVLIVPIKERSLTAPNSLNPVPSISTLVISSC